VDEKWKAGNNQQAAVPNGREKIKRISGRLVLRIVYGGGQVSQQSRHGCDMYTEGLALGCMSSECGGRTTKKRLTPRLAKIGVWSKHR